MAHAKQSQVLTATNNLTCSAYPHNILYTEYSTGKGLRNQDGIKIFFEILLYKIFS